jgi:hypothetical protein
MAQWAVIIPADRWATERLFHHDTLTVAVPSGVEPEAGDDVLLVAGEEAAPQVVGLGIVVGQEKARGRRGAHGVPEVEVAYVRRAFDEPVPAEGVDLGAAVSKIDQELYRALAGKLGDARGKSTWLVSLDLPIEASNPAEAVRQFWSYVMELGPSELPAFVSPSGDELAMQAFVLGAETNLDPEEEDED